MTVHTLHPSHEAATRRARRHACQAMASRGRAPHAAKGLR